MCEPTMMMAAASTAISAMGSYSQYQQQEAYQEANQRNALKARNDQQAQIKYNYNRDQQASADQQQQNATEGMRARGTAATSAGEMGVTGASVDALMGDLYRQEANLNSGLVTGLKDSQAAASSRFNQSQAQAASRYNAVQGGSMSKVLMDTTAAGVNAYAKYQAPKIDNSTFGGNSFSGRDVIRGSGQDMMLTQQWRG